MSRFLALTLILVASPKAEAPEPEVCRKARPRISFERQNTFNLDPINARLEGDFIVDQAIVFDGQPIRANVWATLEGVRPPKETVVVSVLEDDTRVHTVRLTEWSWLRGRSSESKTVQTTLPRLSVGTHTLRMVLANCDPAKSTDWHRTRLEVRPVRTPEDEAQIVYNQVGRLVGRGDCAEALKKIAIVERYNPTLDAVLATKAFCAEQAGDLERALPMFEELQARYEEKVRQYRPPPGYHVNWSDGYAGRISKIKEQIGRSKGQR